MCLILMCLIFLVLQWMITTFIIGVGLLDMTGCPGSVITVLMLSPSKVQYCDNWRMAANLTRRMKTSWEKRTKKSQIEENLVGLTQRGDAWFYLVNIWLQLAKSWIWYINIFIHAVFWGASRICKLLNLTPSNKRILIDMKHHCLVLHLVPGCRKASKHVLMRHISFLKSKLIT